MMFKKQHNNKEVKLETSREIEQRIETPKSTSHSQLQSDLVKLLTISEGRRDQKWIENFCINLNSPAAMALKFVVPAAPSLSLTGAPIATK